MSQNVSITGVKGFSKQKAESLYPWLLSSAAFIIVLMVVWIIGEVFLKGAHGLRPSFIFGGTQDGMFDVEKSGIGPMLFGTVALVMIMTVLVLPFGVITAVFLHEYANRDAWYTRVVRMAVNNLAGVPSIVFGLFGLGFFVYFIGGGLDNMLGNAEPVWGKPAILWAALTMAVLTLPVVVVSTEEALRAVPQTLRDASMGLGASKLDTLIRLVIPQATPGILTGAVLALSRGAGEVAPIMFTGAAYLAAMPNSLDDQFMELGYHIFVLATQSPDVEATKPILYATVLILILLTAALNLLAIFSRLYLRRKYRALQH